MKYAFLIPAGASDEPLRELDGRTPLRAAKTPALDEVAARGRIGTARTIPAGRPPREETGLLNILGYDPREYAVGRGPLEALAQGISFEPADQVFRCDFVTITDGVMRDFAAGDIGRAEAGPLLLDLMAAFRDEPIELHGSGTFRNLLVLRDVGELPRLVTVPPQELMEQAVRKHLPRGRGGSLLRRLISRSEEVLAGHDVNQVRRDLGENPATALWPYGQGPLPGLPRFAARYAVRGVIVARADLALGLGRVLGWERVAVPNADLQAAGHAAVAALDDFDLVCVHVEGLDGASYQGQAVRKVELLEAFDRDILKPLLERLDQEPSWRIAVVPDRTVSTEQRRALAEPTVFALAGTGIETNRGEVFDEETAAEGELYVDHAAGLMEYFLKR